jgi:hypothetical protein
MSGVELARGAQKAYRSDLAVLLTSGYPREALDEFNEPYSDLLLLRKPYRRHELARAVQLALAARAKLAVA